jgi:hypothetical protein
LSSLARAEIGGDVFNDFDGELVQIPMIADTKKSRFSLCASATAIEIAKAKPTARLQQLIAQLKRPKSTTSPISNRRRSMIVHHCDRFVFLPCEP